MTRSLDCGQHCSATTWAGNVCVLKPHEGAHVFGERACVSGLKFRYVDQETADMYPPCGFGGVMTEKERERALQEAFT